MSLTPERLAEIERLAKAATHVLEQHLGTAPASREWWVCEEPTIADVFWDPFGGDARVVCQPEERKVGEFIAAADPQTVQQMAQALREACRLLRLKRDVPALDWDESVRHEVDEFLFALGEEPERG